MDIDSRTLIVPQGHVREQIHRKTQIVLHYTAGTTAKGALAAFLKSGASTAFIVGRDGIVYEVFDPRYWDSHLYRHEAGEESYKYTHEKQTIGIEVVNGAWLDLGKTEKDKTQLYTYTKKPYCTLDDTDRYVQAEYKGHFYWMSFTESQYIAIRNLLHHIADAFGIEIYNHPKFDRLAAWPPEYLASFNGVTTHANYRKDKCDIGPAFDWNRIGLRRAT